MRKTLKNLVQKTVTVTGVKLAIPADRIGLGLGGVAYPTGNLSLGRFPTPHNPEPEQVRSRQLSAAHLRMQMRPGDTVATLAGSAGCSPGASAGRFALSRASLTGWRTTTRTAASGRTHASGDCRFAATSRAGLPGDPCHDDRLDRDCQSPERFTGKRFANRVAGSTTAAGK
jgi:hypothetical protein